MKGILPKCYFHDFLTLIDDMSETSVRNMIKSVGDMSLEDSLSLKVSNILYLHGIKINEINSRRSAKELLRRYSSTQIVECRGYLHAELSIYHHQEWLQIVEDFIKQYNL